MVTFFGRTGRALLAVLAISLEAGHSNAGDLTSEPWQISADKITRFGKSGTVVAQGNVVLSRVDDVSVNPLTIKADWISYSVGEGVVHAKGNLRMRNANEDVDAAEAIINLNNETASLTETTLYMPANDLRFSGRKVEKTGPITYRFEDGDFSTCKLEEGKTLPWQFRSSETVVKIEKTVTLKHSVLRVKGIPVFYMPYMLLPANTKRKSGFLLPEISQSSLSGSGLITPYFIDLSPSSDITLYPGYLSKRGVVAGAEFRYVADYNSRFTIAATYIHDKTADSPGDDYKDDDYLRSEHHRYWIRGKFDHDFGNNLFYRADLDLASDRDYLQELGGFANGFDESDKSFLKVFKRGLDEESLPFRSSQAQIFKTWSSAFLGGQVVGIDDLVKKNTEQSQVNTLPRLLYNGITELENLPVSFSWDSEYVNYSRDEGVGEQRLHFQPRLTAPLPLGHYAEGTISTGVQETLYHIDSQGSSVYDWQAERNQNRTAWNFDANIGTTLERDFDVEIGPLTSLNHAVRPEISYTYQTVDRQDVLPSIDAVDLLDHENMFTYSLNNYFRFGGVGADGPFNRYAGYFKISQSYDLHEERRNTVGSEDDNQPFSDVLLSLSLYPLPKWQVKYESSHSVYGEGVTSYDLYTKYRSGRGDSFSLDYRYDRKEDVNQFNVDFSTKITDTIFLQGDLQESLDANEIIKTSLGILYHPGCWAVKVYGERTADDKRVVIMFSLVGFGQSLGLGLSSDLDKGGFDIGSASDDLDFD